MIIGSGGPPFKACIRLLGGAFAGERGNFNRTGPERNAFVGGLDPTSSEPTGYSWPYTWVGPMKEGALSSFSQGAGASSVAASADLIRYSQADLSGAGDVGSALLAMLVKIQAEIDAGGEVSAADIQAAANMIAALTGLGSSEASLNATIPISASAEGSGAPSANLTGRMRAEASIASFTELSPQNLVLQMLDFSDIEDGTSLRETMRLVLSALAGKVSGADGTTIRIRDINDTKDRIVASVDANGNRVALTLDKE